MNGQKWVKLWVDFLDNEKILSILSSGFWPESDRKVDGKLTESCSVPDKKRDTILMIWVQILCLAGKINANGVLQITEAMPYTPKLLADRLRRKVADVRLALEVFSNLGMIEVVGGFYVVKNWSKYQGSEVEERKREYNRQRYYEGKQNRGKNGDKICQTPATEKRQNLSLQKEKREEEVKEKSLSNERDKKKSDDSVAALASSPAQEREGFVPPTVDQVAEECAAKGYVVDPDRFVEYYTARNWQGVTDWHKNDVDDGKRKRRGESKQTISSFETSDAFEAALRRSYGDQYDELFGGGADG